MIIENRQREENTAGSNDWFYAQGAAVIFVVARYY